MMYSHSDIYFVLDRNGNAIDPSCVPQDRGIAPLHYVCGMSNEKLAIDITKRFLEMGGKSECWFNPTTHNVCLFLHYTITVLFLADPNCRSEDGMTPLHVAAMYGKVEIVRLLLVSM